MNGIPSVKIYGFIPARIGGQRFPKKMLTPILGKTLLQRTYENAHRFRPFLKVIIVTDSQEIHDHATGFGADVMISPPNCETGTDRIAQIVMNDPQFHEGDIIVNIQGDEPLVQEKTFQTIIRLLEEDPELPMVTVATPITSQEEALSHSTVKCVFNQENLALYFSRSLIPGSKELGYQKEIPYYRHLGIYGYRAHFLTTYAKMKKTPLQKSECLEQLKVLEMGYPIKIGLVEEKSISVDTPEDIKKIEKILCQQNTSLSQAEFAPR